MKIAFIIVLFKTAKKEIERLASEVRQIGFVDYKLYFIDNSIKNRGYSGGVNEGIKKGLKDNCEIYINANPDISFENISANQIRAGLSRFDVFGFAMKQDKKIYYGGKIDPLRMSGALIANKPTKRYVETDFVSGSLTVVKKKVINMVGIRDESYFGYYEDVEYCYRAKKAGFTIGIDSEITYEHFEVSKTNPHKLKELSKNRLLFLLKNGTATQKIYELLRLPKTIFERTGLIKNQGTSERFLTNFLSLNISSLVGKILNFILFIFLIKYLSPQEYGLYALVWAQVTLFAPLVDFGTTSYGVVHLPYEKTNVFLSLHNLRFTVSILIFFLTLITGLFIFGGKPHIFIYIFLTSFIIFSNMYSGSYLIKNAVEGKLYNSSILSTAFNFILILTIVLSLIFFKSLAVVFIAIFVFYNLYSFVNYYLLRKGFIKFSYYLDFGKWFVLIKKSYIFILIAFFASLYFKIDVFLLQKFKGAQTVGIYTAGYKFFEALMFIAASYNISRTPIFSRLARQGIPSLLQRMKKDAFLLGVGGFAIALSFFFFAPTILSLFLRGTYQPSIVVARLVIFALPFILISSVILNALYVLNKSHIVLGIFIFQTFINLTLNIIFIPTYSYLASSIITVLSEIINMTLLMLIFINIIKRKYENIA